MSQTLPTNVSRPDHDPVAAALIPFSGLPWFRATYFAGEYRDSEKNAHCQMHSQCHEVRASEIEVEAKREAFVVVLTPKLFNGELPFRSEVTHGAWHF